MIALEYAMPQIKFDGEWPRWLPSLGLVVALHLIVWWGFTHFKDEIVSPKPLPVVQVSLVTPPAPFEPRVAPPSPPKVEKQPRPVVEKRVAAPTPKPVEQPVAETAIQQAPVAAAPPSPPAPEPSLEPPRYHAAYLSNPPPAYPLAARRRGIEGTVLVRAEISAGGECLRVELKKTSGAGVLDQAALEAVKMWRFVPAKRGSQAVVAWVEVPITFKLENN